MGQGAARERPGDASLRGDTAAASCQAAEGAQKPAIAAEPAGRRIGLRRTAQAVLDTSVELAGAGRNVVDTLAAAIDGLVPR
jgi:hypothetical protein